MWIEDSHICCFVSWKDLRSCRDTGQSGRERGLKRERENGGETERTQPFCLLSLPATSPVRQPPPWQSMAPPLICRSNSVCSHSGVRLSRRLSVAAIRSLTYLIICTVKILKCLCLGKQPSSIIRMGGIMYTFIINKKVFMKNVQNSCSGCTIGIDLCCEWQWACVCALSPTRVTMQMVGK